MMILQFRNIKRIYCEGRKVIFRFEIAGEVEEYVVVSNEPLHVHYKKVIAWINRVNPQGNVFWLPSITAAAQTDHAVDSMRYALLAIDPARVLTRSRLAAARDVLLSCFRRFAQHLRRAYEQVVKRLW